MITNIIAFLSSIATAILVGVGLVALNLKYKNNVKLEEISTLLTNLINTTNTQLNLKNVSKRFANLQESYYTYKQNYTAISNEQAQALILITSLKKLLYISLFIWLFESILIFVSGQNLLEYAVATVVIGIMVFIFIKFALKFKYFAGNFAMNGGNLPKPETLLIPINVLNDATLTYISPQLPLNFMEAGMAIELDPPKNPEDYIVPVTSNPAENNVEAEKEPVSYDYSNFFANGRLLFSFNYKFNGELRFYNKHGDNNKPFSISSEYFKAGFSNIYDIGFSYHIPVHQLEKIVLSIFAEDDSSEYATITFTVPRYDELPEKHVVLTQAVATRKNI